MGRCLDTDIDPGFVLQIERLTLAGLLNIFVPFLVSWMLGIFCAFIVFYIYTTCIRFIMVIELSGVQLTGWMNAKRESDWSIKTMTKFEFDRLYTFINQKKQQQQQQGPVEFLIWRNARSSGRT